MSHPNEHRVALVTGANSGLGFEAAAQLCDAGYGRVILACRDRDKARDARVRLMDRCRVDVFETLTIDTSELSSAREAVRTLAERGRTISVLLLNAGMVRPQLTTNSDGIDLAYASTLVGHHALTVGLMAADLLAEDARVIIAGSEAARSDLPGMGMEVENVRHIAEADYDGDLARTIEALARGRSWGRYDPNRAYATAKALVAWWAAAMARRVPAGTVVVAVSPGAAMGTGFSRNMPFFMRFVVVPAMTLLGPALGVSGSVADGARRYLDATSFGTAMSGGFYASPPGKMVGTMELQSTPHLVDIALQEAGYAAMVSITGGIDATRAAAYAAK